MQWEVRGLTEGRLETGSGSKGLFRVTVLLIQPEILHRRDEKVLVTPADDLEVEEMLFTLGLTV